MHEPFFISFGISTGRGSKSLAGLPFYRDIQTTATTQCRGVHIVRTVQWTLRQQKIELMSMAQNVLIFLCVCVCVGLSVDVQEASKPWRDENQYSERG